MKDETEEDTFNIIKSNEINEYIAITYETCGNSNKDVKIIVYIKNNPLITIPSTSYPSLENFFQGSIKSLNLDKMTQKKNLAITVYQKLLRDLMLWSENNYTTKYIDYRMAFPLLKELCKVGNTKFQIIFQQEILKEYATNSSQVKEFLKREGYLKLIGDFF
ncbi:MAG: hypothetical protein KGD58_10140 [Candidatus Lokiarchaeota archaeon]|nr:hypothetical protein [Candidatus Lokiarchaeota archaeon]